MASDLESLDGEAGLEAGLPLPALGVHQPRFDADLQIYQGYFLF